MEKTETPSIVGRSMAIGNRDTNQKSKNSRTANLLNLCIISPTSREVAKQSDTSLSICCLNAQSVNNKVLSIVDYVIEKDIDVLGITETWLRTPANNQVLTDLEPAGYKLEHVPRPGSKQGGGVAILKKSNLDFKLIDSTADNLFTHMEHMDCLITNKEKTVRLCLVYRPPPSKKNGLKNNIFFIL